MNCVGSHTIVDMMDAHHLNDLEYIENAIRSAVIVSGATLLDLKLHYFEPNNGVTGVATLAESHMSIHTWPEHSYAAIDVFMCGNKANPQLAVDELVRFFKPKNVKSMLIERGYHNIGK